MIPANRWAWMAKKEAARRRLADHSTVRKRVRTLIAKVDEAVRVETVDAWYEHNRERARLDWAREARLNEDA